MNLLTILLTASLLAFATFSFAQKPAPSTVRGKQFPSVSPNGSVTFKVHAPEAKQVMVRPMGSGSGLGLAPYPMAKSGGDWMVTTPELAPGFYYYELDIDGVRCPDPNSETYFGWGKPTSGIEIPDPHHDF